MISWHFLFHEWKSAVYVKYCEYVYVKFFLNLRFLFGNPMLGNTDFGEQFTSAIEPSPKSLS